MLKASIHICSFCCPIFYLAHIIKACKCIHKDQNAKLSESGKFLGSRYICSLRHPRSHLLSKPVEHRHRSKTQCPGKSLHCIIMQLGRSHKCTQMIPRNGSPGTLLWHFADTLTDSCVEVKSIATYSWLAQAFAVNRIKVLVYWTRCWLAFAFA